MHAEDVAQVAAKAIANREAAVGHAFNAVSAQALNLRGYAEAMYRWFGHEPRIRYLPFDEWKKTQSESDAQATLGAHHPQPQPLDREGRARGWDTSPNGRASMRSSNR